MVKNIFMVSPRGFYAALALLLLIGLGTACSTAGSGSPPRIVSGEIDLRAWDFQRQGVLSLRGDWGFYWQRLLPPEELSAHWPENFPVAYAPDRWRGENVTPQGYGTYFLRVLLPPDAPPLSLKIRDVGTAYRVYANGVFLHGAGTVGTTPESSTAGFKRAVVSLPENTADELLIVIQASNFDYRIGGLWEHMVLGATSDVVRYSELVLIYSIFLASGICVIGLYHLGLYSLRRKDASTLFFGLACLIAVARQLSTDERYLTELIPGISYDVLFQVEFVSLVLGISTFAAYMGRLLPGCYPRWLMPLVIAPGVLFSVAIVLSSPLVFSVWLPVFQAYVALSIACAFYIIYQAVRQGLEMAWGFMAGFAILAIAVVNDILKSMDLFDSPYYLLGLGLFVFIIIQSYAMSRRSAQAFSEVEALTSELEAYSATLEDNVQQRTAELAAANEKLAKIALIDELTQVANRRHFDEALVREWQLHRRRKLSLSLLLVDIDLFKAFNDTYGHLQGDEALRRVAAAIRATLSRPTDLVARYGGEEFAVLLPGTSAEGAAGMAERIREAVYGMEIAHGGSSYAYVSVSIGGATETPEGEETSVLVERADQCLYRAKSQGRNCVVYDVN